MSEPLSENARLLLPHRLDLHAPDLLLAEFANVICKKVRQREIEASPRCIDSLSMLSETITLHPIKDLVERAMLISLEIEHPVYDCLYVACAEEMESRLITADQKLRLRPRLNTRSFVTHSAERDTPIPSLTSAANG